MPPVGVEAVCRKHLKFPRLQSRCVRYFVVDAGVQVAVPLFVVILDADEVRKVWGVAVGVEN